MPSSERCVVFFDQHPFIGGGQTVLLAMVEAALRIADRVVLVIPAGGALEIVLRQRFDERILIRNEPGPRLRHGRKHSMDFARLACHSLRLWRHWRLLRRADLVWVNGSRQFPAVMLLSLLTGCRCLYHVHIDHGRTEKRLIGLAARLPRTFRVVVNSAFIRSRIVAEIPALANDRKLILVENALDRSYADLAFINRFAASPEPLNVAVLGVLRPEKGQDIAVDLARRNRGIHLHLVGRVGEGAENWVAQLRAEAPANVTFHAAVSDVPRTLDRLGIHVMLVPSRWSEPFGLVAIEGMACSCLTVVCGSGALPEIAATTGALLCRDENEIASTFDRLLRTAPAELSALARRQHAATMSAYAPERFLRQITALLAEGIGIAG